MGHQIKGGPALLLTASVQVCNWTEQRAGTLTLKKKDAEFLFAVHTKSLC